MIKYSDRNKRRIWLTLDRICKVDMNNFRYMFTTGRLIRDPEICIDVFKDKKDKVIDSFLDYLYHWKSTFDQVSIEELKQKRWINQWTINKAKRVKHCYENNYLDLN